MVIISDLLPEYINLFHFLFKSTAWQTSAENTCYLHLWTVPANLNRTLLLLLRQTTIWVEESQLKWGQIRDQINPTYQAQPIPDMFSVFKGIYSENIKKIIQMKQKQRRRSYGKEVFRDSLFLGFQLGSGLEACGLVVNGRVGPRTQGSPMTSRPFCLLLWSDVN